MKLPDLIATDNSENMHQSPRGRLRIFGGMVAIAAIALVLSFCRVAGTWAGLTLVGSLILGGATFAIFRRYRLLVVPGLVTVYVAAMMGGFLLGASRDENPGIWSAGLMLLFIPALAGCGLAHFVGRRGETLLEDIGVNWLVVALAFGPPAFLMAGGLFFTVFFEMPSN